MSWLLSGINRRCCLRPKRIRCSTSDEDPALFSQWESPGSCPGPRCACRGERMRTSTAGEAAQSPCARLVVRLGGHPSPEHGVHPYCASPGLGWDEIPFTSGLQFPLRTGCLLPVVLSEISHCWEQLPQLVTCPCGGRGGWAQTAHARAPRDCALKWKQCDNTCSISVCKRDKSSSGKVSNCSICAIFLSSFFFFF